MSRAAVVRFRADSVRRRPSRSHPVSLAVAVLVVAVAAPGGAVAGKVQICHYPPGNPAGRAVLDVNGNVRELFGGPVVVGFILDALDLEPDGVREFTCKVCSSDDGIGGDPQVCGPTLPVPETELLGCAVRLYGLPENVIQCLKEE